MRLPDIVVFYWELICNGLSKIKDYEVFKDIVLPIINMLIVVAVFVLSDLFRRFQVNNDRKYQQHCDKPIFVFEPIKISYEISNIHRNIPKQMWLYPDDNNKERYEKSNYIQDNKVDSFYRIKNIGKEAAKNIKVTVNFIEGKRYLDKVKYKSIYLGRGRNIPITLGDINQEKNTINAKIASDKPYYFYLNGKDNGTRRAYRIIPVDRFIEIPINQGDLAIFNLHLYHPNNNVIPYVSIYIEYEDRFGNDYNETINIAVRSRNVINNLNDTGYVSATLDEFATEDMEYYKVEHGVEYIN